MTLKKVSTPEEDRQRMCRWPEHNPPMHIVLSPGTYEHTCDKCGKKTVFTVRGPYHATRPYWASAGGMW